MDIVSSQSSGIGFPSAQSSHLIQNGLRSDITLQRNLNNSFAYDLVPSTTVITAALKAARRVNDFPTAVRIFEGQSSEAPFLTFSQSYPLR